MSEAMIKYIVTGGAGLIGSNLVAALNARGETDILVVDNLNHPMKRRNLEGLRYAGYLDKRDLRAALRAGEYGSVETIFHLGACSSTTERNLEYLADNNTAYTRELCEWALVEHWRFIYASSAATYGGGEHGYSDAPEIIPLLRPLNAYGQSKQDFDLIALREGWLDRIAGLKYFNVFGPNEHHKGEMRSVVHKAHGQIRRTGSLQLFRSHRPDYRDGEQTRDFVYVRDAWRSPSSSMTTRRPAASSTAARDRRAHGSTSGGPSSQPWGSSPTSSSSTCPLPCASTTSTIPRPTSPGYAPAGATTSS